MEHDNPHAFNTLCIHVDEGADEQFGAVSTPIFQTSTFRFPSVEEGAARFASGKGYIYTRLKNPTVSQLEQALARLEGGTACTAAATGMAAVSGLYFTFLGAGDHMVGTDCMYGPSRLIMEREFTRFGVQSDFVDTSDPAVVERHWKENTKLLYIETPANPTLKITDIAACAALAHRHGALLAVDNTFLSPVLQNPIALGADIVIHSLTKHINGHSDVVGGAVITKDPALGARHRKVFTTFGGTMDPHQAWLVLRGVKSLSLRVLKAQENAIRVAEFLAEHPRVESVYYPGLKSHPQYELARRQAKGPGSIIAFVLKGGYSAGVRLLNGVKLPALAVSLGGIESLIQHPASMTHSGMTPQERSDAGISEGLVRLSVGCEDLADILEDLKAGLAQCGAEGHRAGEAREP